eukprot:1609354-Rhodomonas_salina.4
MREEREEQRALCCARCPCATDEEGVCEGRGGREAGRGDRGEQERSSDGGRGRGRGRGEDGGEESFEACARDRVQ